MKRPICVLVFVMICIYGENTAQSREGTFQMLNIPVEAPVMAMGGYNISWGGGMPSRFLSNPALSGDSLHQYAAFNYVSFSGAYHLATAGYHHNVRSGTVNTSVRHLSFGEMQGLDDAGNPTEDFTAGQTAVTVGYQLNQGNFSYGLNIDFVNVGIAGFNSNAITVSAGGLFLHPEHDLTIGFAVKHLGFILNEFTATDKSRLPSDVQIGITYKPKYMPFRFSLTGHHLFNNDLLDDAISSSLSKEILSHVVIGTELVLSRSVSLMAGYNHLIRQELKLQQTAKSAGFSYGFLWRTKNIQFAYGRGAYHAGGASHVLSLNINLNTIFRKI